VHPVNPSPGKSGERDKVLIICEPHSLEPAHLADGGCLLRYSTTANNQTDLRGNIRSGIRIVPTVAETAANTGLMSAWPFSDLTRSARRYEPSRNL
jgi:hypothetical protein